MIHTAVSTDYGDGLQSEVIGKALGEDLVLPEIRPRYGQEKLEPIPIAICFLLVDSILVLVLL